MKNRIIKILYWFIELLPLIAQEKIKIILNVLYNDWRLPPYRMPGWDPHFLIDFQLQEIENIFEGLDEESLSVVKRFLFAQKLYLIENENLHYCIYSRKGLYTKEEYNVSNKAYRHDKKVRKKYGLTKYISNTVSSSFFQHGLINLSEKQKELLKGTAFIDAGAFIGDSSLMLLEHYAPSKVYAFEPSEKNCNLYSQMMKSNHISPDRYELVKAGLGDTDKLLQNFNDTGNEETNIYDSQGGGSINIYALDSYWEEDMGQVGFIKADVEGAAVDLLRGAEQTIRKYLPVLSIGVYHNQREFFGVYQLLKSWDLPYHYEMKKFYYCWDNAEVTLVAIPLHLKEK